MTYPEPPRRQLLELLAVVTVILMLAVGLAGCGTAGPKVVYVPTPVPCRVVVPAEPKWPFDTLVGGEDIHTKTKTLLADRELRIDDRRQLVAAAEACS